MKKPATLSQAFGKAARRLFFGATLAAGMLAAESADAQVGDQMTEKEKTEFADKFITDAVLEYPLSADPAKNHYSRALDDFEKRLNRDVLPGSGTNVTRLSVMDPVELDVALALGFKPGPAVQMMAARDGITLDFFQNSKIEEYMTVPHDTPDSTRTNAPIVFYYMDEKVPQSAVLVPFDLPVGNGIGDLTLSEERAYVNRHESWHLKDSKYKTLTKREMRSIELIEFSDDDAFVKAEKNPLLLKFYSERNRQESLADVGATGDMVRAGHGLHIIRAVADWRGSLPSSTLTGNVSHISTLCLEALEKKIRRMGIDKFRKLGDAEAAALYMDIIDRHAQSPESLAKSLRHERSGAFGKMRDYATMLFSPATMKGVSFSKFFGNLGENRPVPKAPAPDFWDPLQALQDQAFRDSGIVTPKSVIAAYGKMQEKLMHASDLDTKNRELHTSRMLRLRQAFIDGLRTMPYADINMKLGLSKAKMLNPSPKGTP